nr:condensation domain-containing protein [Fictibacillus marinisediminis]
MEEGIYVDNLSNIDNFIKTLGQLSSQERSQVLARLRTGKATSHANLSKEKLTHQRVAYTEPIASFWQEQMWYLEQLSPDLPTYNVPFRFNLKGPLSVTALTASLNEIEKRHESLRTTLQLREGKVVQVIAPVRSMELPVTDLSKEKDPQNSAMEFAKKFMQTTLNLADGPLYRVHLLQLDEAGLDHVLLWVGSHAIADGWSLSIIIRELISLYGSFYRDEKIDLDELPIQFGDFAIWQRENLSGETYERILNYWKEQLDGCEPLRVETDFTRPAIQSMRGDTCLFSISKQTADNISKISKRCGVTPFTILLAAYQLLLVSRTGQNECVLGTGITGRTKSEVESLIGSFVNIIVIRTKMSGDPTFIELVERVRHVTLEAIAHQDLPFGKLIQELAPERDHRRPPLCQTMFIYGSTPLLDNDIKLTSDLDISWDGVSTPTVKFDFELAIDEQPDGLFGRFDYCTDLFRRETAEALSHDYVQIVEAIAQQPELRLSALCPTMYKQPIRESKTVSESAIISQSELLTSASSKSEMSTTELTIAKAWSNELGINQIERTDDFFAVGGHSVMAAQMVMQFREQFGIDLTLQNFLENTTVYSLANVIDQLTNNTLNQDHALSLLDRIEQLTEAEVLELIEQQEKSHSIEDNSESQELVDVKL